MIDLKYKKYFVTEVDYWRDYKIREINYGNCYRKLFK